MKGPRLYAIADSGFWELESLADGVTTLAEAGVPWIQLRLKQATDAQRYRVTEQCCRRLEGSDVGLWIDDRTDLATMLPLAGVHLGQQDLPPAAARPLLGSGQRIGLSTHSLAQVGEAEADPAVDVVALGPIFDTRSKRNAEPVVGLATLARARALTAKPLVAIGGIDAERIAPTLAAGADVVALIGALGPRAGLARRCRDLLKLAA